MEKKIDDGVKLGICDEIVVNVLGRDIPAKISNFRNIDWQIVERRLQEHSAVRPAAAA